MPRYLRRGLRGNDVAKLQADLNRYLQPVPLLAVDGIFGRNTELAVVAFQRREGLVPDGIVGPKTFSALERNGLQYGVKPSPDVGGGGSTLPQPDAPPGAPADDPVDTPIDPTLATSPIAELATQIALTQTHVREEPLGSNRGPEVDRYIRSAGEEPPGYWCMSFVYWCFDQAAGRLGAPHPMQTVPAGYKDYVTGVYAWAKQKGKTVQTPIRGDIFCVQGGSEGRTHSHTGLVTSVDGGSIGTIEGNTNNDGSSNGIGVFARTRSTSRLDFIRLP